MEVGKRGGTSLQLQELSLSATSPQVGMDLRPVQDPHHARMPPVARGRPPRSWLASLALSGLRAGQRCHHHGTDHTVLPAARFPHGRCLSGTRQTLDERAESRAMADGPLAAVLPENFSRTF